MIDMKVKDFLADKYFVLFVVGVVFFMKAFEKIIPTFSLESFLLVIGLSMAGSSGYAAIVKIRHLEKRLNEIDKQ